MKKFEQKSHWELIGKGGSGKVYKVPKQRGKGFWAVKVILLTSPKGGMSQRSKCRMVAQARLMASVGCKRIVAVRKIQEIKDAVFLYMDYIEGCSLKEILKGQGPLREEAVIDIGIQLCDILGKLHHHRPKIIYRDMKPANVLIDARRKVYLTDFDIIWIQGQNGKMNLGGLGTEGYAPPEQYEEMEVLDERTDIYALGITLMELLTDEKPWEQKDCRHWIQKWRRYFSDALLNVIEMCTQPSLEKRYSSCRKVKWDLKSIKRMYFCERHMNT